RSSGLPASGPDGTVTVCACPPRWSAASNSVTSYRRRRRYAETSPAHPAPTTATVSAPIRRGRSPVIYPAARRAGLRDRARGSYPRRRPGGNAGSRPSRRPRLYCAPRRDPAGRQRREWMATSAERQPDRGERDASAIEAWIVDWLAREL